MSFSNEEDAQVRYISLVRREGGEPILGIPYKAMSVDPDLVASFVLAIIIFENRQLKTFTKEGYTVVIEEGQHVVGLLIIDKLEDDQFHRIKLREIIDTFEEQYETQLSNWKGDIRPFREFALYILGVYPYIELEWNLVPKLIEKSEAVPDYKATIPWSVGSTDVIFDTIVGFINGKRTISEIRDASGIQDCPTMAIFSMLDRYKWITFTRHLGPQTILIKIEDPPMFLKGVYGDKLDTLVDLCDGKKTLDEICTVLEFSMEVIRTLAKNLIDAGVLAYYE
ncbi:MAG: hypothetical protein ACTSUB_01325 [Candidatus Thorarchaeota archaeon]